MLDPSFAGSPEPVDASAIAAVAKALAHPARVRIIEFLLSRPGCIGGDIVDEVGLAQSTVSEHLRILKASGLVVGTIERPRICYSLDPAALAPLHALIGQIEARSPDADDAPPCYTPKSTPCTETSIMTTITVFDPPMCCSTGVCGAEVDQRLVDLAADLDWLKAQGVTVRRITLSQEPAEFAANATIAKLMQESDGDDLPAFLVDGRLAAKARYPSRAELAAWAGVSPSAPGPTQAPQPSTACCGADDAPAESGCCGGGATKAASACC